MATRENPNVVALRQAYAHWRETKGDCAHEVLELFDDEIEMRSVLAPDLPSELAGPHDRKDRAAQYFEALAREWEMLHFEVHQLISDERGDDIVMVGRCAWRHRETGAEVDTPKVDIWHFENGKATRFMEMFDSLAFAKAVGAV
jgi:uncharacterized protein